MSPSAAELAEYRAFARAVALDAGTLTLSYYRADIPVDTKDDQSPVTRADRESEALIRARIGTRYPEHLFLGEEDGLSGGGDAAFTWVVDPIDGTRSFVTGVPFYAVLVALVAGRFDGTAPCDTSRVLAGVIHMPALGETVHAARGLGCEWETGLPPGQTPRVRPARVSDGSLDGCRFATTDFANLSRRRPALFEVVRAQAAFTRTWGDAYGYLLVATGRMDAMVDTIVSPWDIAPLPVIIEEAGGRYTDLDGAPSIGTSAVASNGRFHDELTGR